MAPQVSGILRYKAFQLIAFSSFFLPYESGPERGEEACVLSQHLGPPSVLQDSVLPERQVRPTPSQTGAARLTARGTGRCVSPLGNL